jgi:hypothetical protein
MNLDHGLGFHFPISMGHLLYTQTIRESSLYQTDDLDNIDLVHNEVMKSITPFDFVQCSGVNSPSI